MSIHNVVILLKLEPFVTTDAQQTALLTWPLFGDHHMVLREFKLQNDYFPLLDKLEYIYFSTVHLKPITIMAATIMYPVSEIKLLFCALAGCTSHKTVHPEISLRTLPICSNSKWLKKRAHTRCTPLRIMHPAVEMCTPGAGCTLTFAHCVSSHYIKRNEFFNGDAGSLPC